MSGAGQSERRRVRLFVAIHLAAVGAIYGLAIVVGSSVAATPTSPQELVALRAMVKEPRPYRIPSSASTIAPDASREYLPDRSEIAPPWSFNERGDVQLRP